MANDNGNGVEQEQDPFIHELAIKLSRALNIINPNELLARRVIDIAKTNTPEGFAKGAHPGKQLDKVALTETF
jgi:hypothetical protein